MVLKDIISNNLFRKKTININYLFSSESSTYGHAHTVYFFNDFKKFSVVSLFILI